MRNIVVFGDESTLKDVTINSDARVARGSVFLETIEEMESTAPDVISEGDIERIYDILRSDVPVTDEVIKDHIAEVEHIREQKAYEKDYTGDTCPRCGSSLRMLTGRYGAFYSCSRYPACSYRRRIS